MEQRLIDADAAIQWVEENECYTDKFKRIMEGVIDQQPTVDAVPWEFLERYADWFCASVSFPQFIKEAKAFYKSSVAAMDGFIIADGERKEDGN